MAIDVEVEEQTSIKNQTEFPPHYPRRATPTAATK